MIRKEVAVQIALVAAASLAFWLAGCGYELETGYKYRPLNASSVQRRGYYASPYSPEKDAAEQEQKNGPKRE
jgi:hypothetical protein